jgi:hypothetical protein
MEIYTFLRELELGLVGNGVVLSGCDFDPVPAWCKEIAC